MRVSKDPAQRKQELVDTALELFLTHGYEKTSVKDIVSKVGVAQGLFYYYFPSKEDIVKEISEMYSRLFLEQLHTNGLRQCPDALEMVRFLLRESFEFLSGESHLIKGMHMPSNKFLHDSVSYCMIDALAIIVQEVMEKGNETGALNCKYPRQLATAFIYGVMAAIHHPEDVMTETLSKEKGFVLYFTSLVLQMDEDELREHLQW